MAIITTGDVGIEGNLYASGSKNFKINHPIKSDSYLVHSAIEGPESGVYFRGRLSGSTIIYLPNPFSLLTTS